MPRTLLVPLLALLLAACSGGTETATPTAEDSAATTPAATTPAATTTAPATAATTPTNGTAAGTLEIPAWGVVFTLPDAIPVDDVTLSDHAADGFVDLRSATLQDALDTEVCGGSSVEHGEFAQVVRRDDESADDAGNVAVGGHTYHVEVFTHLSRCYPDDLVQRYLSEDVAAAILTSLTTS